MKTTAIRSFFFLTCLALFAAGCGKSGGGGGSSQYGSFNPIQVGTGNENIEASAVNAYNSLVNWRNNLQTNPSAEGRLIANGRGYARGVISVNNGGSSTGVPAGCEAIKVFGVNVGYYCTSSGSQQQQTVTPLSIVEQRCTAQQYINNVVQLTYTTSSGFNNGYCVSTGNPVTYTIAGNTELNQILAFEKGKILSITQSGYGSYTIIVGNKVPQGYQSQPTAAYVIDTSVHSIYNPITSQSAATINEMTTIYQAL